jgi:hypothetical protein
MSTTLEPQLDEFGTEVHLLWRGTNDRVREQFDDGEGEQLYFFCECRDPSCTGPLLLTVAEYDTVCASGLYAVLPGHESRHRDEVVGRSDAYVLVRCGD